MPEDAIIRVPKHLRRASNEHATPVKVQIDPNFPYAIFVVGPFAFVGQLQIRTIHSLERYARELARVSPWIRPSRHLACTLTKRGNPLPPMWIASRDGRESDTKRGND